MSFMERVRVLCVCGLLEFALLTGMPMRPDEIRALMQQLNQPAVARQLPSEKDSGEP